MKTAVLIAIISLSINFAYTNVAEVVNNEAAFWAPSYTEDTPLVPSDEDASDTDFGVVMWSLRQCFPGDCNAHCSRLGHTRGACIGNFCQCRLQSPPVAFSKEESAKEIESSNRLWCNLLSCMNLCSRLGFRYSRCINASTCRCWN